MGSGDCEKNMENKKKTQQLLVILRSNKFSGSNLLFEVVIFGEWQTWEKISEILENFFSVFSNELVNLFMKNIMVSD